MESGLRELGCFEPRSQGADGVQRKEGVARLQLDPVACIHFEPLSCTFALAYTTSRSLLS